MSPIKRASCPQCLRAQTACICRWITPTANEVQVLILQHPMEVHHSKGSARLLHLSLQHSQLIIGESFDPQTLHRWLNEPALTNVLLYPPSAEQPDTPIFTPNDSPALKASQMRLVVLDGTWRKSRKMLHLAPLLQQLPRLVLNSPPHSQYTIRKAHQPHQLSTLEAVCCALQELECKPQRYQALTHAFAGFVQDQRV